MLYWNSFLSAASIRDFFESLHEIRDVSAVPRAIDDEGCRCSVEQRVAALDSILVCVIIGLEWSYELSLGCDSSNDLEVVEDKGPGIFEKSFINPVIACKSKVYLPPVEIHVLYAVFLRQLSPVAPTFEALN